MITIVGPTASGKTDLAAHLAARLIANGTKAEIISGDSRQVFRGMDIGTGKDLADYTVKNADSTETFIPYHLIDICEAGDKYNIFRYQQDFMNAYDDCRRRDVLPILCGGSGLYVETVLKGYHLSPVPKNEELRQSLADKSLDELTIMLTELKKKNNSNMHNRSDVDTAKRAIRAIEIETYNLQHPLPDRVMPEIDSIVIGTNIDRELRREKITRRLRARLEEGMVDEIRKLLEHVSADDLIYYGLEYKYMTEYVIGKLTFDEMFRQLEIAIHQFAKRQMTWFRGMERRGFTIHWVDASQEMDKKVADCMNIIRSEGNKI
ncbi:MAG: tRNA (adenosine(37)-N6)-dimethylallyltransferase MiaA [Prevotellaceae bacterium]|nr:tRNA (adenosine(37)-N6)-dimethylallyltransferase MiaA [Prevotellaceae bacterium]